MPTLSLLMTHRIWKAREEFDKPLTFGMKDLETGKQNKKRATIKFSFIIMLFKLC